MEPVRLLLNYTAKNIFKYATKFESHIEDRFVVSVFIQTWTLEPFFSQSPVAETMWKDAGRRLKYWEQLSPYKHYNLIPQTLYF